MKLSFSILLLVAAVQIQAAVNPKSAAASKCISGSSGKGNGDGYKGYCCKDSDDCFNACVKGVCNGSSKPDPTPTPTPTPGGKCTPGSKGLGNGDGYKGYCCDDSDDCINSCVSGVCNGPTNTATKTTTTKTTTATATATPGKCSPGSQGLKNGDGYKGDCCDTSDDCVNNCVNGVCNGEVNPNPNPGKCIPGYKDKGNGKGPFNACCSENDDCQEACVRGRCTKP
ncbi:hypothetical protein G6F57_005517 [Rhizopus arrhizus]|uniref:Uncharacterized protein n=1 Tax=Rhizopus oryzae TaxID=64495 RepID=A0A9P7BXZ0_RHIOR|nr:hypothetical protein G6F24_006800 [Rhizopus arrhizus]KAG1423850.1 hypothetical protein G6F58_002656 [Rhizopus delemar]KAG0788799.1 hypothetical protein G6F21_006959 [Rhizopus arrhizus]KAG0799191.1 hypothetical protein G6F22_003474 [Rhizopus arrhizus]KAG0810806.1 hypothetical protein G6F20_007666 [Rhizopus arrhizus]